MTGLDLAKLLTDIFHKYAEQNRSSRSDKEILREIFASTQINLYALIKEISGDDQDLTDYLIDNFCFSFKKASKEVGNPLWNESKKGCPNG